MWDEDSNVCSVHEDEESGTEQMAEEAEEEKEPTVDKSVAMSETDSINAEDILAARKQQLVTKRELRDKRKAKNVKKARLARFLEEEAELGSDNEEHDHVRKRIKSDDDEENESGLDSDLDGFVDNGPLGDDEEIEEANAAARERHLQDVEDDEDRALNAIVNQVILGQNKKRKRGDFDLDTLDDASKRKLRRLEERQNMRLEDDSDSEIDLRKRM